MIRQTVADVPLWAGRYGYVAQSISDALGEDLVADWFQVLQILHEFQQTVVTSVDFHECLQGFPDNEAALLCCAPPYLPATRTATRSHCELRSATNGSLLRYEQADDDYLGALLAVCREHATLVHVPVENPKKTRSYGEHGTIWPRCEGRHTRGRDPWRSPATAARPPMSVGRRTTNDTSGAAT